MHFILFDQIRKELVIEGEEKELEEAATWLKKNHPNAEGCRTKFKGVYPCRSFTITAYVVVSTVEQSKTEIPTKYSAKKSPEKVDNGIQEVQS